MAFVPLGRAADPSETERIWKQLAGGGYVILIRHATTDSGIGDPPNFKLDDCSTQRNLSAAGRAESEKLGAEFRRRGIPVSQVLSSPWCRCVDTAKLAFGKEVEVMDSLASSFRNVDDRSARADVVKRRISRFSKDPLKTGKRGNLIMVTHQFNIIDITGRSTGMGDMVVVRADGCCNVKVVGVLPAVR
jgi:phosphohistidine phosphatase SixA